MRPGDEKTATILAMQDELTALGMLSREARGPVSALLRGRRRSECGTEGAASRHRKMGEPLDRACAEAERKAQDAYKARRAAGDGEAAA